MLKSKVVSTRLTLEELAKTRDGLIARGITPDKITSVSQILRTAVFLTILNCHDPKSPASEESVSLISQAWSKTKLTKNIQLGDILGD